MSSSPGPQPVVVALFRLALVLGTRALEPCPPVLSRSFADGRKEKWDPFPSFLSSLPTVVAQVGSADFCTSPGDAAPCAVFYRRINAPSDVTKPPSQSLLPAFSLTNSCALFTREDPACAHEHSYITLGIGRTPPRPPALLSRAWVPAPASSHPGMRGGGGDSRSCRSLAEPRARAQRGRGGRRAPLGGP